MCELIQEEQNKTGELRDQKAILEGQVRELRELTKQLQDSRYIINQKYIPLLININNQYQ